MGGTRLSSVYGLLFGGAGRGVAGDAMVGENVTRAASRMPIHHFYSTDYEQKTGGWIYNRHLIDWLDRHLSGVREITVPVCFPTPDAGVLDEIAALFDEIEPGAVLLMDHIYGCMLLPILRERKFRLVLIYHHSMTEERGEGEAATGRDTVEKSALELAGAIIVTSDKSHAYIASGYGIADEKIVTAKPGNDPVPQSPAYDGGPWRMLSVGAVIPRKRYEFLIEALAKIDRSDWSLIIVGNTERYPDYVASLQNFIDISGLNNHITLTGELSPDALEALWQKAHLYAASSLYEGYGMAISEALCRGIPVISTPSGAVASWAAEVAMLVDADDPAEIAERIAAMMGDAVAYGAARERAKNFAAGLPSWEDNMAIAGEAIRRLGVMSETNGSLVRK
ncbi:glycosyltransferase family 4 protein [Rhizobium panacihumi]|uniref:glycosyltransferase family 4 protein n=1 Tax=Rhizobium panacihumi TaxID=2008450 RepID=UPI003D799315